MVDLRKNGMIGIAVLLIPLLAACGQKSSSSSETAKPQAIMSAPVSGERNAAASNIVAGGTAIAASQSVDFGDDGSQFSKDGECDDKRFSGPGMTSTPLLDSDVGHDANDCRTAYDQHRLTLTSAGPNPSGTYAASGTDHIMWGDDSSKFSRDGECDDKRFSGTGMTDTPLLDSDVKHDATDCRSAFAQGRLKLGV